MFANIKHENTVGIDTDTDSDDPGCNDADDDLHDSTLWEELDEEA